MSVYVQHKAVTNITYDTSDSWIVLNEIEQSIKKKIEAVGTPLKDWNININYGIKTGFNDAFIISTEKKNELIALDPKSADIIRPILRDRDIKRYEYCFADLWLLFIPWHFPLHEDNTITGASAKAENVFSQKYPAVYNHLLQYKKQLEKRNQAETGIRYVWYALQRWGAKYWNDFSKPKIVWGNLCLSSQFAYVEKDFFINAPSPMIVPGNKYLLAILNSKLADWYIRQLGVTRNGGYFEYKPMFVEKLPVPLPNDTIKRMFSKLIDDIAVQKQLGLDTTITENELNEKVYALYKISSLEKEFIEAH